MEVLDGEQFGLACRDPAGAGRALALRTMAIATGVIGDLLLAAVVALVEMTTSGGGAALLNVTHDLAVREW